MMEVIKKGIVFSDDIKRILNGNNALDYQYKYIPSESVINAVRNDFKDSVNTIFNNKVFIISEEEMLEINKLIGGEYPHCYSR